MKRTRKSIPEENTIFFQAFMGEYVEIAGSFVHENESMSIRIEGYLLAQDDNFFFLGKNPDEITHAIKKSNIVLIQTVTMENEYTEILNNMEIPPDNKKQ